MQTTEYDPRFDEAESDVDHGTAWRYREPDAPNPLTILATGWSTGMTKLGEAEFLQGIDREGKSWSVLVGSVVLTKRLIEGIESEWDDDKKDFVVTATLGRVKPGEVVSIKYLGDVDGARYKYPNFKVSRKPPTGQPELAAQAAEPVSAPAGGGGGVAGHDDDLPFL
jgi:hypothetical protein